MNFRQIQNTGKNTTLAKYTQLPSQRKILERYNFLRIGSLTNRWEIYLKLCCKK